MSLWFWRLVFSLSSKKSKNIFKGMVSRINDRNKLWTMVKYYTDKENFVFRWILLRRIGEISNTFVEMWGLWSAVPKESTFAYNLLNKLISKAPSKEALELLISKAKPGSKSEGMILAKLQLLRDRS